jgi:hypothetical protein
MPLADAVLESFKTEASHFRLVKCVEESFFGLGLTGSFMSIYLIQIQNETLF